jgi:hypothetical protein
MPSHKNLTKSGKYNSYKGTFRPLHPEKYIGDDSPKFKSRLEQKLMYLCDKSPHVKSWSYERIVIPYTDKTRKNSRHNYYMDFKVVMDTAKGSKTFLVEVKSKKETVKPVNSKRKKPENYKKELETYVRNQCKWEAASKSAHSRGWEFKIFTEDQLG